MSELLSYLHYVRDVNAFVRDPIGPEEAEAAIRRRLQRRSESFLEIMRRGVFARPESPYARLLRQARIDYDDLRILVDQTGIEGTLERLYDEGVYAATDELKGRKPVKRGGLEFDVSSGDFANPFVSGRGFTIHSSGSTTGSASVAPVDFGYARDEAMCHAVYLKAHGIWDSPSADLGVPRWMPLYYAKLGRPMEKFFSVSSSERWTDAPSRAVLNAKLTVFLLLLRRLRLSNPQPSKHEQVEAAAQWLARQRGEGTPGLLVTFASPAVRVCLAAKEHGWDISGSVMRLGGEPLTPGKARVLQDAGVRATVMYVSVETGTIAASCSAPQDLDDAHLFSDRLAAVQRPKETADGNSVGALYYTSLSTSGPRLLLNAESGDYATVENRDCDCLLGEIGLTTHLSGIRSYEKLTSEGVTFIGGRLYDLLDQVLPARFGGNGVDYQLVEEEEEGRPRVSIVVAPRVGPLDEDAVITAVTETLRSPGLGDGLWTDMWQQAQTLRVVRREPHKTVNAKVLPLHVRR